VRSPARCDCCPIAVLPCVSLFPLRVTAGPGLLSYVTDVGQTWRAGDSRGLAEILRSRTLLARCCSSRFSAVFVAVRTVRQFGSTLIVHHQGLQRALGV